MKNSSAAVSLILAFAIIGSVVVYVRGTRYTAVDAGQAMYRVDRITGETVLVAATVIKPAKEPLQVTGKRLGQELTGAQLAQVQGTAALSGGVYSGKVYNGNADVFITEFTLEVEAVISGEATKHLYRVEVEVPPQDISEFYVSILRPDPLTEHTWRIEGARGVSIRG